VTAAALIVVLVACWLWTTHLNRKLTDELAACLHTELVVRVGGSIVARATLHELALIAGMVPTEPCEVIEAIGDVTVHLYDRRPQPVD
jgi:hypothetical protein